MTQPRLVLASLLAILSVLACSKQPAAKAPSSAQNVESGVQESPPRPELSADERIIEKGLRKHASQLSEKIGERNTDKTWELAEAADYLALELEALGYPLERQGYDTEHVAAQNLAVTVGGGMRGDQIVVVGTHYDSAAGQSGNSAALATAALLEIARMMQGAKLERTLRLVFYSMGEPPHAQADVRGARHYARQLADDAQREPKAGMPEAYQQAQHVENVAVFSLGALDHLKGSDTKSDQVQLPVWISNSAIRFEPALWQSLNEAPLHLARVSQPQGESDVSAALEFQLPVISLGRVNSFETANSTSEPALREVDFVEAARIVMALRRTLGEILAESPTNDGMVTPLLP